eukprot:2748914-Rhodomonas_salina.2
MLICAVPPRLASGSLNTCANTVYSLASMFAFTCGRAEEGQLRGWGGREGGRELSLIHISEPTRPRLI